MGSMKVHQFARGFWEHEPSLTLGCKRLRPLAPKLANSDSVAAFDLKSFIRPESGPRKLGCSDDKRDSPQVCVSNSQLIFYFNCPLISATVTLTANYCTAAPWLLGSCLTYLNLLLNCNSDSPHASLIT